MINNKRVAKRYAKAFLRDDAIKDKITILADEAKALAEVIKSDKQIEDFFTCPITPREVKLKVVRNIVKRLELSSYTRSFLELLIKKGRMAVFSSTAEELQEISDRINDRVRVSLTTAYEPSVSELKELAERISKYFGREAVVERKIDPSIIGGFIIKSEDNLIDMSVKGQIRRILSKV